MLYSCFLKPSRDYLRGFLIAAWGRVPKLQSVGESLFSRRILFNTSF